MLTFNEISEPIQRFRLRTGLPVIIHPFHSPAVGLSFMVKCGPVYESLANNGISHFLEHMLYRGIPAHPSSEALGFALDRVGSEANAATFSDMTLVSHKVLPEALEDALGILHSMVTEPLFKGIAAERQIISEECLEDYDDEEQLIAIDQLSSQMMFDRHPYSYPILGLPEVIRKVNSNQLRKHLRTHYRPSSAVLCLAGEMDAAKTLRLVDKVFGTWQDPSGAPPLEFGATVPEFKGPRVLAVDSSRSQVQCRLSFRGLSFNDPDFPVFEALARIIDSGSGSPLRKMLQDEWGFCYSFGAGADSYEKAGALHIDMTIQPDRLLEAVKRSLKVLAKMAAGTFTQASLDHMIAQYVKNRRFSANDLWDFSGRVAFHTLFPGSCPIERELEATQNLTLPAMHAMTTRVFQAQNLGITLVGSLPRTLVTEIRKAARAFPG